MPALESMIRTTLQRLIDQQYPHVKYPPAVLARVTSMEELGDRGWRYSLRLLGSDLSDRNFPEIPEVDSRIKVEAGVGGTVAVALLYGRIEPFIINEVI